ncbi:carboxymuconolactone decarboxylase family protein [Aquirhabdus parva]|uniref:Carboxymuconolactone decarboxylase family protein n=1 Tax=Aquirhabdus parva TaxID=2283318 RepID=A0A345P6S2_9GAMM|nr:carboxymuconolactone decarboxylase family protein [Aquirhabdus parva]AXI02981.1 carboxymuconolactone decarboxylase family protein [Aquirhabdus parva]
MTTPIDQQLTPSGGWHTTRVRIDVLDGNLFSRTVIKLINKFGKLEASNLFKMLIRNFSLFRAWLPFAARMMPYGEIDRCDTELVILRVGWNCRSRYEWGQHVDIGLRAGLSVEDIARIPLGAEAIGWKPRHQMLMQACDEFHHDRMISEPTWQQLSQHYNSRLLLEVIMLIGHYEMLAGVLNSTGLPLESRLEKVLATTNIHSSK